uniref:Transmembrane protein 26like [Nasonia vitripennis] n=1 Tax=Lepeophtheirus salmonis TaxID=72036 RepID=A0A0K2V3B7_LEPSM
MEASVACRSILTDETRKLSLSNEEGLKKILDINVNIALKPEQWTRILEQIALVVLILGRWLLPKGSLSRDQFSQLMLVYIGMAADIVEIFEAFRESKVILEPSLTYAILGVWTLSLFQFCLILSGGHRARKHRMTYNDENEGEEIITVGRNHSKSTTGSRQTSSVSIPSRSSETSDEDKKKRVKMDMIAIIASLALQDGPFICLRMTLIFRFGVISHMNIFFTCKNTLVILLQMYRLLILCLELRPQYRKSSRQFSIIPYSLDTNNESGSEEESHIEENSFDNIAHLNDSNISESNHKKRQRGSYVRNSEGKQRKNHLKSSQRLLLKGINSTSEELALSSTSEREDIIEIPTLQEKHLKKVEIDSEAEHGVTSGYRIKATLI